MNFSRLGFRSSIALAIAGVTATTACSSSDTPPIGRPEPDPDPVIDVVAVPHSLVGPGKLKVVGQLAEVVAPSSKTPAFFHVVPTAADTVAVVTGLSDERRLELASWPPKEVSRRHLFDGTTDFPSYAFADNGDATYAVAAIRQRNLLIAARVTATAEPKVTSWAWGHNPNTNLAMATAKDVTLLTLCHGDTVQLGRADTSGQVELTEPLGCVGSFGRRLSVITVGENFLTALPTRDDCTRDGSGEVTIFSTTATGDLDPIATGKFRLEETYEFGRLVPRPSGAWFVSVHVSSVEIVGISPQGQVVSGPTAIPASVARDSGGELVFDVAPTPDGGVMLSWLGSTNGDDVATGALQLLHVDGRGLVEERGQIPLSSTIIPEEVRVARLDDTYLLFLRLSRKDDSNPRHLTFSKDALDVIGVTDGLVGKR